MYSNRLNRYSNRPLLNNGFRKNNKQYANNVTTNQYNSYMHPNPLVSYKYPTHQNQFYKRSTRPMIRYNDMYNQNYSPLSYNGFKGYSVSPNMSKGFNANSVSPIMTKDSNMKTFAPHNDKTLSSTIFTPTKTSKINNNTIGKTNINIIFDKNFRSLFDLDEDKSTKSDNSDHSSSSNSHDSKRDSSKSSSSNSSSSYSSYGSNHRGVPDFP